MTLTLEKKPNFTPRRGPVVLAILDGVGFGKYDEGDAVKHAYTPCLKNLMANYPMTKLKAHGTAVGLPSDEDMGNSEVGHNAIGAGRVFAQGAKLVSDAIASGRLFEGDAWKTVTQDVLKNKSTLHFLGLFSDGNVHSHIDHLKAMVESAVKLGIQKVRIHILLDGRDVPETSALDYIIPFEKWLAEINQSGLDYRIASGGGRQVITMDRYNANWNMVKKGWATHVRGEGRFFKNAQEAVETLRRETGMIDQDLPPFVISDDEKTAIGTINDGDGVIFFNFRGDRAIEITAAFEEDEFSHFDRGIRPKVTYAGMMQYDGDLKVPKKFLVSPPVIDRTVAAYLCDAGIRQLAVSETQKFGHVTYFYNGNRSGMFNSALETYIEVLSDVIPFEQRPWMKCAEITDKVIEAVQSGKYDFIRLNFPNGDMVGHTGNYQAVLVSMGALDICLERIYEAVKAAGGVLIITADHGNADDMYEHHKKSGEVLRDADGAICRKTAHSLNPVPCIVIDPEHQDQDVGLREGLGISSIGATVMDLLGFVPPADYDPSVLLTK